MLLSQVRDLIEAAISATDPDGRYSVEDDGLASTWTVAPDFDGDLLPRDLLARVRFGGGTISGKRLQLPVAVDIVVAAYTSRRTMRDSLITLSAEDRLHEAARHLGEVIPASAHGLLWLGYTDPRVDAGSEWLSTALSFALWR